MTGDFLTDGQLNNKSKETCYRKLFHYYKINNYNVNYLQTFKILVNFYF